MSDAARVLHASKLSFTKVGKENQAAGATKPVYKPTAPLLLSFPTESVYMLACCVKTASSRSIRDLLSRADSQTSLSSSASSKGDVDPTHQGSFHQPNACLDLMLRCNDLSNNPTLFVFGKNHALNYCHFTKPKTFAIRPASFSETPVKDNTTSVATVGSSQDNQTTPYKSNQDEDGSPSSPDMGPSASPTSSVTPTNQKLCAASFSESREAFLRLASKFWPGPVVIHVQARMLGEAYEPASKLSEKKASVSSIPSLPSLPSMGDLVAAASFDFDLASVPVLPPTVLIPASRLLSAASANQDSERYFVGMQCPSHPLPRRILNEVYRASTGPPPADSRSQSSGSLASMSSDENVDCGTKANQGKASSCGPGRARSSIAVVGCMVSSVKGPGAVTAKEVKDAVAALSQKENEPGRVFVLDGEDTHESFSVPTCQYGGPHPVSILVDGENRTIHLVRRQSTEGKKTAPTKDSIYRALRNAVPHGAGKDTKGHTSSIDRVITAVLSRWKVEETVARSGNIPSPVTMD
jgi:tRNA A37 threonylcarbamoyladenosine synthetase subunit TsaC/SUA5/YrdC